MSSTKRLSDSRSCLCSLQLCEDYSASAGSHSTARWSWRPRLLIGAASSVHHNSAVISGSCPENIPVVSENGEVRSPRPETVTAGTFSFRLPGATVSSGALDRAWRSARSREPACRREGSLPPLLRSRTPSFVSPLPDVSHLSQAVSLALHTARLPQSPPTSIIKIDELFVATGFSDRRRS